MTEQDKAYLAGIIDGEGCIGIYRRGKSTFYQVRLTITGTDERLAIWLISRFGRQITLTKKYAAHHSQGWHWSAYQKQAIEILLLVEPYLVIKKDQAKLAINFFEARRRPKGRVKIYSNEELVRRETICQLMHDLNSSPAETKRESILTDDAIVRTMAKAIESAEMADRQGKLWS